MRDRREIPAPAAKWVDTKPGKYGIIDPIAKGGRRLTWRTKRSEVMDMAKKLTLGAILSLAGTALLLVLYRWTAWGVLLSLAITGGTLFYHLAMRLGVGLSFQGLMRNRADCKRRWYRVGPREMAFYERLGVKRWKGKMPTYDGALFDPRVHTWEEIAQAMCQAELVHETIAVLSFVPIAAGSRFGAYPVFIATSVLAAGYDLLFVAVQRYNRRRIMALLERKSGRGPAA